METTHSILTTVSNCVITKEEVKNLYETLIVSHLANSSQPMLAFDAWYKQLDSWDRRIIHASQLKRELVNCNFNDWNKVSKLIPGLKMEEVTETIKLSRVINEKLVGSPRNPDADFTED
jgi:hypothetical protein